MGSMTWNQGSDTCKSSVLVFVIESMISDNFCDNQER
jgi:hypothetical protein